METVQLQLWRHFIIGRSLATGVFCATLFVLNGVVPGDPWVPLYGLALVQFGANAAYYYLWTQRDIPFLGYLCFGLEIILITLLIHYMGRDGYAFVLAYLWPIIMGGWLMGRQAVLPLTLMALIGCSVLLVLSQMGLAFSRQILTPGGLSLPVILSMPYMAFVSLLVWLVTREIERGQDDLQHRNAELRRINARLEALVQTGEDLLSCLNAQHLLPLALHRAKAVTGHSQGAILLKQGDRWRVAASSLSEPATRWLAEPRVAERLTQALAAEGEVPASILWGPVGPKGVATDLEHAPNARAVACVALRSLHGPKGVLAIALPDPTSEEEDYRVWQVLGHQLGLALENARLFEDLRHDRDLLRGILSSMSEGVFVIDEAGPVLLANHAATSMLAVREGGLPPPSLMEALQSSEDGSAGDRCVVEHEGHVISVSAAELSEGDGIPRSTIYVARDMSEEAALERAKSDFVAYITHELRTPLTTIKTLVRLLLMDAAQDSKPQQYLEVINTQVNRQSRLVNNLLDLTRLEAGRYDLPLEAMDPHAAVRAVVSACRPLADEKGIRLEAELSERVTEMHSSRAGLEQVVTNLVGNAIKFTDSGGRVVVSCRQEGEELVVAVEDTGIGMTAEQLAHIFNKFYTVHHPTKRGEGTGLGLAISHMIARKLGGAIHARSALGKGSCFTLRLPMVAEKPDVVTT